MVAPSEQEIATIVTKLNITDQLIRYPLDIAERPHIDDDDDQVLIIVDVPMQEIKNGERIYTTMPLGMLMVRDDIFITISQIEVESINLVLRNTRRNMVFTEKKSRLIIQILYNVAKDYIKHMTAIIKSIEQFEKHMAGQMTNQELMFLLDFEKSMIYFNTSIKANQIVLQKINRGKTIKLYEEDEEILEDTLIENTQAIEMIQTYSEILNGIIDIFGTITSNNVNIVMKFLTSITLIITIPTMIASFLGMNVEFPFLTNTYGFYGVLGAAVVITTLVTIWLKKKDLL
ncbi:Magnesium transport protein CorA [compost metagenome]